MLTPEQLRTFTNDGFIVIPQFISPHQCELLQRAADNWVNAGLEIRKTGEPLFHHTYLPAHDRIVHVEQLHRYEQIEALELAGMAALRSIVEQLCGPDAAWIYEGLHIHTPEAPVDTPWMQAAVFADSDAKSDGFTKGINLVLYLDPVPDGEHGYYFLPASHRAKQDICALREERGWDTNGLSEPRVQQGDLLLYHPMLAQCFNAKRERQPNEQAGWCVRTLQLWYRHPDVAREHFPDDWLEERKRLHGLGMWVNSKLSGSSSAGNNVESQIEQRAKLYQTMKEDLLAAYAKKVIYPSANFCLDFKTGDRITTG